MTVPVHTYNLNQGKSLTTLFMKSPDPPNIYIVESSVSIVGSTVIPCVIA